MKAVAIFFIIFEAHVNILFNIKVNILGFVKWSYRSSQLRSLLNLECSSYFGHAIQSLSNICLFAIRCLSHTKAQSTQIRVFLIRKYN